MLHRIIFVGKNKSGKLERAQQGREELVNLRWWGNISQAGDIELDRHEKQGEREK